MTRSSTAASRPHLRVVAGAAAVLLASGLAGCGVDSDEASTTVPGRSASASAPPTTPPSTGASSPTTPPVPTTTPRPPTDPVALSIPAMGLREERLIGLGLDGEGAMEVPDDPDRVGWFTGGGRPGGTGPTVLAGHVDSRTGPAVFYELTRLRTGDLVTVTGADGRRVDYRVTRTQDVPKDTFPTEAVFGATADDQLRLITCTGEWDRENRTHLDNRVVWAEAVA